ncbi:class I SAM-dependent methyltransferase [Methylobacterium nigriterrae]|uniref:class I SAM-dependent methyltransferase n=1 Tax=Methylobacterium nigriterrae TaxID=3127512 RepID=UPI0030138212
MSDKLRDYALGHAERELVRLSLQDQLLAPFTRSVFSAAGIGPGTRVIDLGCGGGDVSLLLAEMVGLTGQVLAVDGAPEALAATKARFERAGLSQIDLAQRDLSDPESLDLPQGFDAAVGRLVLHYVPERAALIRRLTEVVRPGGVLAFVEMDISVNGGADPSPLAMRMLDWMLKTFQRGGFEPDTGSQLFALFRGAGLQAELMATSIVGGGADSPVALMIVEVIRSLAPRIIAAGVATAEEIDVDTLAERLRSEPGAAGRSFYLPRLTAAWAHTSAT